MGNVAGCTAVLPDDLPKNTLLGAIHEGDEETPVLRRAQFEEELVSSRFHRCDHSIATELDLFEWAVEKYGDNDFLGTRGTDGKYVWRTYSDVKQLAVACCEGLFRAGLVPVKEFSKEEYEQARRIRPIGLFFKNREEWYIIEQAANIGGLTLVPLYDSLSPEGVVYIINQTSLAAVAVDSGTVETVLDAVESMEICPVTSLILLDIAAPGITKRAKKLGLRLLGFSNLLGLGNLPWKYHSAQYPSNDTTPLSWEPEITTWSAPAPQDVQTICYTSGATARPKGAILTHKVQVSAALGCLNSVFKDENLQLTPDDVHLSYLPLAHSFERLMTKLATLHGMKIGLYSGSPRNIIDDLGELQPTVFVSVPRLLQRIFDGVSAKINSSGPVAAALFNQGLNTKIRQIRKERNFHHGFWDKILFNKIKERISPRLNLILSGAAPLDLALKEKLQAAFSVHMLEGYGLTETMGCVSIRVPFDSLDHLGSLIPSLEMKLISVPELNYRVTDKDDFGLSTPTGEVLVRGNSVSPGYFCDSDETGRSYRDGWFCTGDIGTLENGVLKIIDRRKNIFKLSQGEYVVPEKLELQLSNCNLIESVFLAGRSTESCLVALIVLNENSVKLLNWCDKESHVENVQAYRDDLERLLWLEIRDIETFYEVKGFERVKRFHILTKPVQEYDPQLLTPTLKLRRHLVAKFFQWEIDAMYDDLRCCTV
ncbi:MAG: uncharacterized protein KVP18_004333 [Porospora cf. gigantea A]|uniref:uncharacterized protein n=1 Tax=Porospora cf. gigantea A TaxID=2853593 RepID=UPI0035595A58|nr:MAG: hypothetical protein KVP18_004333 [Porospora cf. gigantea A]